ncbi:hypothetical protein E2C01_064455 [Portunus trituberculatus]|uniref:Uncharacterized protein n=1 Tax=Portunus trituberculatus TaxID=210409 RepID=A0A5B7HJ46_PORTR|nr:hypothetical protein [Portunus trituberculatus]
MYSLREEDSPRQRTSYETPPDPLTFYLARDARPPPKERDAETRFCDEVDTWGL